MVVGSERQDSGDDKREKVGFRVHGGVHIKDSDRGKEADIGGGVLYVGVEV